MLDPCVCQFCGRVFTPKRKTDSGRPNSYCSRGCTYDAQRRHPVLVVNDPDERWIKLPLGKHYEISSFGRIRNANNKRVLSHKVDYKGYYNFHLYESPQRRRRLFVNRLVLMAFVGPPPGPRYEAAHLDGNPVNNRVSNLKWATHTENNHHTDFHGTRKRGSQCKRAKLNESIVAIIKQRLSNGIAASKICKELGVNKSSVYQIKTGRNWRHVTSSGAILSAQELWPDTKLEGVAL